MRSRTTEAQLSVLYLTGRTIAKKMREMKPIAMLPFETEVYTDDRKTYVYRLGQSVPTIHWLEDGKAFEAQWRSHSGTPPATRVVVADGKMTADEAYGLACQGTALLWRGDFQEARQMLNALGNRADRRKRRSRTSAATSIAGPAEAFHLYRQARSQRARLLNALLIPLNDDYTIPLRRAPDIRQACTEAYGPAETASVTSLRALLGVIGAHEWRVKGIELPEAGGRIHPHFGVFAPIRREYVDLVSTTVLPAACASSSVAFDIGTGTGVLAAVLARRGIERVVATDLDPRALACARENVRQLGLSERVDVVQADLFPDRSRGARDLQSAMDSCAAELAHGKRNLRSRKPNAARIFGKAAGASGAGRRGVVDPFRSGGASGLTDSRAVARRVRSCGVARPGPKRCAAATSASRRQNGSAPYRACG